MAGACVDPGCTPGDACVAEDPCFTGVIACDGPPSCVPGAPAPAGVPCGAGRVCSGDGACVPCGEGTPCSVNHPCQRGALACDSGSPVCEPAGFEPLGAPCEEGNVCDGLGACLVPPDCMVLRAAYPEATSGVYIVDFDGAGPGPTREVFCDMELEGGGWTLWPAPEVDALPANAGLPRCGMSLGVSCYAGAFVGRGYRDGVYKIPDGNTALALQNDLSWKALGAGGEQRDGCKDVEYCKAGNDRCLFSLLLDGSGCCTDPDQFNFCLQ